MSITWHPGLHIWIGIRGPTLEDDEKDVLRDLQPSGVVLFSRNCTTAEQVIDLIHDVQQTLNQPAVIAIDEEGGKVERLKGILPSRPPAAWWSNHPDWFAEVHFELMMALRSLGIHMNLAPVVDLAYREGWVKNEERCYHEDPEVVTRFGQRLVYLSSAVDMMTCLKHFPGLGAGKEDTHTGDTIINRTFDQMWEHDLLPYRMLARVTPAVMVAHARYPGLDERFPASLSSSVYRILRRNIRFGGLALTDDLHMDAVAQYWSPSEAGRHALNAGADVLLICQDTYAAEIVAEHLRLARKHRALESAIHRSHRRWVRFYSSWQQTFRIKPSIESFSDHKNRLEKALEKAGWLS